MAIGRNRTMVRWLPAGVLTAFLLFVYGTAYFTGVPPAKLWKAWGVPSMEPLFFDAHAIGTWFELRAAGADPGASNPLDPMARTVNYPPSIFVFGYLGWRVETVPWAGAVLAFLYVVSVAALARPCTWAEAFLWTALVISPALLLPVERGNLDLLIFALMVLAMACRNFPWLAGGVLSLAVWWKFFPVAGLGSLWSGSRKVWPAAAFWTLLCGAIFWHWREVLQHTKGSLQHEFAGSFGVRTTGNFWLSQGDPAGLGGWIILVGPPVALLGALVLVGLGWWWGMKRTPAWPVAWDSREVFGAWLAAPVFALLFLSGTQFDYKLLFLLPMVPLLWACASSDESLRLPARGWLALLLLSVWWSFFSSEDSWRFFFLKQAATWGLFAMTAWWGGLLLRFWWNEAPFFARRKRQDLPESAHA